MHYQFSEIEKALDTEISIAHSDAVVEHIALDSRKIAYPKTSIFLALPGQITDGHNYLEDALQQGVTNFIITKSEYLDQLKGCNVLVVENGVKALKQLARYHRRKFNLEILGITGSNGKTIIKEWLYQTLFDQYTIVKSPKSYNSQIGVPLSLLQINAHHDLGIFEVGISGQGEMEDHEIAVKPTVGILSNVGSAHDEGFPTRESKILEKIKLFKDSETLIYCKDQRLVDKLVQQELRDKQLITWGEDQTNKIQVISSEIVAGKRNIQLQIEGTLIALTFRFSDAASFENLMHVLTFLHYKKVAVKKWPRLLERISGLHMRLELTSGIDGSIIVNDAYSADLDSLKIACQYMAQQIPNRSKVAILSKFEQSGISELECFIQIVVILKKYEFDALYYVSKEVQSLPKIEGIYIEKFKNKDELKLRLTAIDFTRKAILIKGSRRSGLEEISRTLSYLGHSAILQINLAALENNIRVYRSYLQPNTKMIAVIKASAYGSGAGEIATVLKNNNVEYLAVAIADEGITIRRSGINLPIIVFNPDITSLPDLVKYDLEPEVYDLNQLKRILDYLDLKKASLKIHIKIDTGMHRLGFSKTDIKELGEMINSTDRLVVGSIFSHLAASDDPNHDAYTNSQASKFQALYSELSQIINQSPPKHISNSGGISRFSDYHFDFVRLGIGMYGIDSNSEVKEKLQKVHQLRAKIIQVKHVKKGETIGYNRMTTLEKDSKVGIVNIGYADGLMRNLGNRKYSFIVNGMEAPILGNVCMDLTIIDLSGIEDVGIGHQVTIFDEDLPIEKMSEMAGTIPYEILSRISNRVKRKFYF